MGCYVNFAICCNCPEPRGEHKRDFTPKRCCRIGNLHTRLHVSYQHGGLISHARSCLFDVSGDFEGEELSKYYLARTLPSSVPRPTRDNLRYIDEQHGSFIAVLPRNRKEDDWFREWVSRHDAARQKITWIAHPDGENRISSRRWSLPFLRSTTSS